jgi:hypothetical protein
VPAFSDVQDIDNDGRPDLLSRLHYEQIGSSTCGVGFVVEPIFAFHSLRGGGFTRTDAVAKKYFDDKCGSGTLENALDQGGDLGKAIVCARVRGKGVDTVVHTLTSHCAKFSDTDCDPTENDAGKRLVCPSWALTLAKEPTL